MWLGTVVGGMLLRAATGGGVQLSFVLVAATVLAVFLLGWRLLARLLDACPSASVERRRLTPLPVGTYVYIGSARSTQVATCVKRQQPMYT